MMWKLWYSQLLWTCYLQKNLRPKQFLYFLKIMIEEQNLITNLTLRLHMYVVHYVNILKWKRRIILICETDTTGLCYLFWFWFLFCFVLISFDVKFSISVFLILIWNYGLGKKKTVYILNKLGDALLLNLVSRNYKIISIFCSIHFRICFMSIIFACDLGLLLESFMILIGTLNCYFIRINFMTEISFMFCN